MPKCSGFTLIEMLVTMSLLSMIVLAGTSAFGLFSKRWDGQLGRFDGAMVKARDTILVQEVLDNLVPYMVYSPSNQPTVYFEGNRNGFVAVSGQSVFSERGMAVVRFSVRQNEDLTFSLLYEEWPMVDDVLRAARQPIDFSEPLVLFESVKDPRFEYFGWESSESRWGNEGEIAPQPPKWMGSLNAVDSTVAPLKARFKFQSDGKSYVMLSILARQPADLITSYSGARKRKTREKTEESEYVETSCFC